MRMLFQNRTEAGRQLASRLSSRRGENVLVLAIPRGGVVVGYEVAQAIGAPLDVVVPRKLGAPGEPELAIGAVATWGDHEIIVDEMTVRYLGVSQEYIEQEARAQMAEIDRRMRAYRGTTEPPDVRDKEVIVVDDGIATGSTMLAAVRALRRLGPRKITVAVPVASPEAVQRLTPEVDEFIALSTPSPFAAVGYWYRDFAQTTDDEVRQLLHRAAGVK